MAGIFDSYKLTESPTYYQPLSYNQSQSNLVSATGLIFNNAISASQLGNGTTKTFTSLLDRLEQLIQQKQQVVSDVTLAQPATTTADNSSILQNGVTASGVQEPLQLDLTLSLQQAPQTSDVQSTSNLSPDAESISSHTKKSIETYLKTKSKDDDPRLATPTERGKVDMSQFSPGDKIFANLHPYEGKKAYDITGTSLSKWKPLLDFSLLGMEPDKGTASVATNQYTTAKTSHHKENTGSRSNNPLNISGSDTDINRVKMMNACGLKHYAVFNTIEDGVASAMRLLVRRYNNRSVRGIDCGNTYEGDGFGFQGQYRLSEDIALSALRIMWITNVSKHMGVSPFQPLNLKDKNTLYWLVNIIAGRETGYTLGTDVLDKAYAKAFG